MFLCTYALKQNIPKYKIMNKTNSFIYIGLFCLFVYFD